jgi:Leucine-rich repeat (LRR) protein
MKKIITTISFFALVLPAFNSTLAMKRNTDEELKKEKEKDNKIQKVDEKQVFEKSLTPDKNGFYKIDDVLNLESDQSIDLKDVKKIILLSEKMDSMKEIQKWLPNLTEVHIQLPEKQGNIRLVYKSKNHPSCSYVEFTGVVTKEILIDLAKSVKNIGGLSLSDKNNAAELLPTLVEFFPHLKGLYLGSCNLKDVDFKEIIKFKSLERLKIEQNENITPQGLLELSNLKHLNYFVAAYCKLTEDHLKEIGKLTNLTTLDLGYNYNLTGFIKHLVDLENLEILYLDCCGVENDDLKTIAKFKELKYLGLRSCKKITGFALDYMAQELENLKEIDLLNCSNLLGVIRVLREKGIKAIIF